MGPKMKKHIFHCLSDHGLVCSVTNLFVEIPEVASEKSRSFCAIVFVGCCFVVFLGGHQNSNIYPHLYKIKAKNVRVRETAYNTLVRPQLECAAPIWDTHTKQKIFQLEKVQRRAVRLTTSNYEYRSSVTPMLQRLGWRTLEQRWEDARLCLFYKIVYGLVAVPLPVYIQ